MAQFKKNVTANNLQFLFETFLILRTDRDMIKNVDWSSCKVRDESSITRVTVYNMFTFHYDTNSLHSSALLS